MMQFVPHSRMMELSPTNDVAVAIVQSDDCAVALTAKVISAKNEKYLICFKA
jgi:hypothetical protein